jgi:hypothetical protein
MDPRSVDHNGISENEGVVLSQIRFSDNVSAGVGHYLDWMEFEIWCLEAWHALWSGAPLKTGLALTKQLKNHQKEWKSFLIHGKTLGDKVWIVDILTESVALTQTKASRVNEVRRNYHQEETELNRLYTQAMKRLSAPSASDLSTPASVSHLEVRNVLFEHITKYVELTQRTNGDLDTVPSTGADEGLGFVHAPKDVLDALESRNVYEFQLPEEKQFQGDISRMSDILQNSSELFRFLTVSMQVEKKFLSKIPLVTSLSMDPALLARETQGSHPSYADLVKCYNIWGAKDIMLQKYLSQPILR